MIFKNTIHAYCTMRLHDTRECEDFFLDKIFYVSKMVRISLLNSQLAKVESSELIYVNDAANSPF